MNGYQDISPADGASIESLSPSVPSAVASYAMQQGADGYMQPSPEQLSPAAASHDDIVSYTTPLGEASGLGSSHAYQTEEAPSSSPRASSSAQRIQVPSPEPSNRIHHDNAYDTKALPDDYFGEDVDAGAFRGSTPDKVDELWSPHAETAGARFTSVNTNYMDPEQQAASRVSVENGLLQQGGSPMDTSEATGVGTYQALGRGKHIFAMTPEGEIRAADAWAEHTETPTGSPEDQARVNLERRRAAATGTASDSKLDHQLGMTNHSSFVQGGEVAGAGELTVDNGQLTQVSDQSGHYLPDNVMTHQALHQLDSEGVDMHDVSVKLTPKTSQYVRDSPNANERYLHASAREMMSYEGAEDAEQQMRQRRRDLSGELGRAVGEREDRMHPPTRDLMGRPIEHLAAPQMRMTDAGGKAGLVPVTPELLDPRANVETSAVDRSALPVDELVSMFEAYV